MYSITININDKPHSKRIPQSWNDVQWIDYINALQAQGELLAVLEALTGIPKHIIEAMTETDFQFIETQCSFFWTTEPPVNALPTNFIETQIAQDTWQKLIDAEQEFTRVQAESLPQIAAAQMIIKSYTDIDIKGMSVVEALPYWDFFFSSSKIGRIDGLTSTTTKQMTTRLQQGLRKSNSSVGLQRSPVCVKATRLNMRPCYKLRQSRFIQHSSLLKRKGSTRRIFATIKNLQAKTKSNESANG
jgi:hypothetical protein